MVMFTFTMKGAIEKIERGTKTTTTRLKNERREASVLKNKRYDLYWRARTKECFLIGRYPFVSMKSFNFPAAEKMPEEEREEIARKDGFDSWEEMYNWFLEKYGEEVLKEKEFTIHEWDPKGRF